MMRSFFAFAFACFSFTAVADSFPGWQGLRVIKAEHGAHKMHSIRLNADEPPALMVVETRQSRLDFYRYVGRGEESARRSEHPNYLPMAEDFEKTELPLTRLPHVATVYDVDGDGVDEIFLVQGDPRKLVLLKRVDGEWETKREWLIAGSDMSSSDPVLVRPRSDGSLQLLVSFVDGIQSIEFDKAGEVEWLQPRERDVTRNRWWLADLDGDGDLDLVEAMNTVNSPVRWYESDGDFIRPAANISDDISNTNVARLLESSNGPKVAFLGANQSNTISFYSLGKSEESVFGRRNFLPLAQPDAGGWASVELDGELSIVEMGRDKPVLNVYKQAGESWRFLRSFPILQGTRALKSVRDEASTILFQVEGEGQLFSSRWDGNRFTFPKRVGEAGAEGADWKLLAFEQYGADTWWVTQRGDALVLSVWAAGKKEPSETVFPEVKGDYESCVWLGGETLLVKKRFSRSAEICRLVGGRAVTTSSRFKGGDIRRIRYHEGSLFLAEKGVVQKLDGNLEAVDQIMLGGDYSIRSFAPIGENRAFALEEGGRHVHIMEQDDSGLLRSMERAQVPYCLDLAMDPLLGLTFVGSNHINVPSEGASPQLVLDATVDPNEGSARSYDRRTLGTIFVLDIDGDGVDEVATVDYLERNIIVYGESEDGYREIISWKVYDDGRYPYGQDTGGRSSMNPYRMLAFDIDGDGHQDLVMASHDRILIYLAKDKKL